MLIGDPSINDQILMNVRIHVSITVVMHAITPLDLTTVSVPRNMS